MGISCSCFSRFERALEYSDDSPDLTPNRQARRSSYSSEHARSNCLDTIIESSERASSGDRKLSDDARLSGERARSQELRRSGERRSEERRSAERRRSSEKEANDQRRADERHMASEIALDDTFYAAEKEEDLKVIAEILKQRQTHTPQQVARFMALLRASPGHTPFAQTDTDNPPWLKTLTPDERTLTGNSVHPDASVAAKK